MPVGILTEMPRNPMSTLSFGPVEGPPNTFDVLANVLREMVYPSSDSSRAPTPRPPSTFAWIGKSKFSARIIWEVSTAAADAYAADVDRSDAVFASVDPNAITGVGDDRRVHHRRMPCQIRANVSHDGVQRRWDRATGAGVAAQWFQFITTCDATA